MPLYLGHPDHEPGGKKSPRQPGLDDMDQAELNEEFAKTLALLEGQDIDALAAEGAPHKAFADLTSAASQYRQKTEDGPDIVYKGGLADNIRAHLATIGLTLSGSITSAKIRQLLDEQIENLDQERQNAPNPANLEHVRRVATNLGNLVNKRLFKPDGELAQ